MVELAITFNEFVWQSETDDAQILDYLQRYEVDGICATH